MNILAVGAERASDHAYRAELYYNLATQLHDHRMWEASYAAFTAAHTHADAAKDPDLALRAASQRLYLAHYLADWGVADALRAPTLALLEESLATPAEVEGGPALHPWMSISLPMDPALRLRIAQSFCAALRLKVLASSLRVSVKNILFQLRLYS